MDRFFLGFLVLTAVIASSVPRLFLLPIPLDLFMAVTMFAIGAMLPRDEVRDLARRWPAVIFGSAVQ